MGITVGACLDNIKTYGSDCFILIDKASGKTLVEDAVNDITLDEFYFNEILNMEFHRNGRIDIYIEFKGDDR